MRRAGLIGMGVVALCATTAGSALAKVPVAAKLAAGPVAAGKPTPDADGLLAAGTPKGYVIVHAGPFDLPAGVQRRGIVKCPGQKVPLGGGAFIQTSALLGGINSSFPQGRKWIVDANNGAFSPTTFTVYAICAKKPAGYQVLQSSSVPVNVNATASQSALCAAPRVPVGGGVLSSSGSPAVNVVASYPTVIGATGSGLPNNSWSTFVGNTSSSTTSMVAFAVCANTPRGFRISISGYTPNPSLRQSSVQAACPAGAVPVSGGSEPDLYAAALSVNSSYPSSGVWRVWQNNPTDQNRSVRAYAVCASG